MTLCRARSSRSRSLGEQFSSQGFRSVIRSPWLLITSGETRFHPKCALAVQNEKPNLFTVSPSYDPTVVAPFVRHAVHPLTLAEQEILLSFIFRAVVLVTSRVDSRRSVTRFLQTGPLLERNATSARPRARGTGIPLGPVALLFA